MFKSNSFIKRSTALAAIFTILAPALVLRADTPSKKPLTEEKRLQFRQGFVAGREENFAGKFRGTVFNFEYVAGGRPMAGRFYFLKTNESTIYMLRFTGPKDGLRVIRSQTDSIARTFSVK